MQKAEYRMHGFLTAAAPLLRTIFMFKLFSFSTFSFLFQPSPGHHHFRVEPTPFFPSLVRNKEPKVLFASQIVCTNIRVSRQVSTGRSRIFASLVRITLPAAPVRKDLQFSQIAWWVFSDWSIAIFRPQSKDADPELRHSQCHQSRASDACVWDVI